MTNPEQAQQGHPDPTPTPAQVLEQFEASLTPLEYADDTATHYSVPIEIADAAVTTLRAQAAALAEREAECERLRSLIAEWVQAEDELAEADALDRRTVLSVPEYERVNAADARYRAAYLALKDEALTPTQEAQP